MLKYTEATTYFTASNLIKLVYRSRICLFANDSLIFARIDAEECVQQKSILDNVLQPQGRQLILKNLEF